MSDVRGVQLIVGYHGRTILNYTKIKISKALGFLHKTKDLPCL